MMRVQPADDDAMPHIFLRRRRRDCLIRELSGLSFDTPLIFSPRDIRRKQVTSPPVAILLMCLMPQRAVFDQRCAAPYRGARHAVRACTSRREDAASPLMRFRVAPPRGARRDTPPVMRVSMLSVAMWPPPCRARRYKT